MTRSRDSGSLVAGAAAPRDEGEWPEEAGVRVEAVAVSAVPVSSPLDALFDYSLNLLVAMIKAKRMTKLPVPDIKQAFVAKKMNCEFEATRGTAGDLSSLFRDGPTTLREESRGVLVLEAAAGLRHLRLHFPFYRASAGILNASGTIEVEASPASARVQLQLEPSGRFSLRSFRVAQLGPLQLNATGLGLLSWLLPLLQNRLNARIRDDIESLAQRHLVQAAQSVFSKL